MKWLLGPYAEARTYRAFAYLLLGLPLGVLEFTVVITGLSVGLGLAITLLGIPVLIGTCFVIRGFADFERRLAISLLDAPMPPARRNLDEPGGFWARLRSMATSRRTWMETAFLLLRLPVGTIDFTVAVSVLALALGGFVMPVIVAAGVPAELGSWKIDTFAESLVCLPVSVLFILVGPRLILGWSSLSRRFTCGLIGRLEPVELRRAVVESLARVEEADGFEIFDDLTLRLGRGPYLTPTRLEAALLSLRSTGAVATRGTDSRTLYSLAR